MLLVAQRVAATTEEGYNSFCHLHGPALPWVWELPDGVPDHEPGVLATSHVDARGVGRVRAFLDIAMPDSVPAPQVIQWAHDAVVALFQIGSRLPFAVSCGPWLARFEVEPELHQDWHGELHRLREHLSALSQRTVWAVSGQVVAVAGEYRFLCFESARRDPAREGTRLNLQAGATVPRVRGDVEAAIWVRT